MAAKILTIAPVAAFLIAKIAISRCARLSLMLYILCVCFIFNMHRGHVTRRTSLKLTSMVPNAHAQEGSLTRRNSQIRPSKLSFGRPGSGCCVATERATPTISICKGVAQDAVQRENATTPTGTHNS